jgi:carbon starvation protein
MDMSASVHPATRPALGVRGVLLWGVVGLLGAGSLGVLALHRGETVSALWLVTAALCTYAIAYRFYSRFLAARVVGLDAARATPAVRRHDGLDYVATNRVVLFGHHFAAIAGAGPLVGPVLAAQMGYLPGTLWILVGVVFAGAVQDFLVLAFSARRDGRSLGEMIRSEMGAFAGTVASVGVLAIMMILLAVLALIVVKALAASPWGTSTIIATMPIAVAMGLYLRFVRPSGVLEASSVGVAALLAAIWLGGQVAATPALAAMFTLSGTTLAWLLMGYGFAASVLPVWLLLAPRDYLSTFLKIGTIAALAVGILVTLPVLHMPAVTRFIDGTGPVFAGSLFPFLFITIACGSVSGFHALVSSGTTPKMLANETDARMIGYGAMLAESGVAIMALIAASVLQPGAYFAMNAPAALVGADAAHAAAAISAWGFAITPDALTGLAHQVGETTILARAGGAPTLAVGMATIFSGVLGGDRLMAFWYHFAILFEALFILTTIDAGTRVARFMVQDFAGLLLPGFARTSSFGANLLATAIAVGGWGYFLYQGVVDPLGGINTLWPLFGIANQMLAAIALTLCTVVLFKMKKQRFAWVTLLPTGWLAICTLTAGGEKIFSATPAIGFLAHAAKYGAAAANGTLLAPAHSQAQMQQIILNDRVDVSLTTLFMAVVIVMLGCGVRAALRASADPLVTAREVGDDLPLLSQGA